MLLSRCNPNAGSTKIVDTLREAWRQQKMLTAAQCRGARALLDITQSQLAEAALLGLSTVVDFEKGRRQISDEAKKAIHRALERAGIEFIDEDGGGAGVRFRRTGKTAAPR
jgi:transcriptional regulator with XRE-family HTH domain